MSTMTTKENPSTTNSSNVTALRIALSNLAIAGEQLDADLLKDFWLYANLKYNGHLPVDEISALAGVSGRGLRYRCTKGTLHDLKPLYEAVVAKRKRLGKSMKKRRKPIALNPSDHYALTTLRFILSFAESGDMSPARILECIQKECRDAIKKLQS